MQKKNKRVLIDTFYLHMAMTGVRTYTIELCKALEQNKCDNHYIFFPDYRRTSNSKFFKGDIPYWKRMTFQLFYFIWKVVVLPSVVRLKDVDAVVSPDYMSPPQKLKAIKFSVIHDAFFWEHPENYNEAWRQYYTRFVQLGLRGKSAIITTSFASQEALNKALKPKVPVEVVYQSSSSLAKKGNTSVLSKLGIEKNNYIIHIGYFDKRKNLTTLVEAFSLLCQRKNNHGIKLVLAGKRAVNETQDDYRNVLELVEQNALENKVLLPGYLDSKDLPGLYENALCYVFPSYSEGFGIPVIEAMSYGLPVIISNIDTLREIGGNAVISFETFDPVDLCNRMLEVIENPALRQRMRDAGKIRSQTFSSEKFSANIDQLISKYA